MANQAVQAAHGIGSIVLQFTLHLPPVTITNPAPRNVIFLHLGTNNGNSYHCVCQLLSCNNNFQCIFIGAPHRRHTTVWGHQDWHRAMWPWLHVKISVG